MRRLLLTLCLALLLAGGCQKIRLSNKQQQTSTPQPTQQDQPAIHAPTGVVVNPGGGGGGGGAVGAVRKAVKRTATMNDMHQMRIAIANMGTDTMPTKEQITADLKTSAPNAYKLWEEGALKITGTKNREYMWAYTTESVSNANYHLILSSSGIEQISPDALEKRKKQEGVQ